MQLWRKSMSCICVPAIALCSNGELWAPMQIYTLHATMARTRLLVVAACMHQRRDCDFGICYKEPLCSLLMYTAMARRLRKRSSLAIVCHWCIQQWQGDFGIYVFLDFFTFHRNLLWHGFFAISNRNPLCQSLLLYVLPSVAGLKQTNGK